MKNLLISCLFFLIVLPPLYGNEKIISVKNVKFYETTADLDYQTIVRSNLILKFCSPATCASIAKEGYNYWFYCEFDNGGSLQYICDSPLFFYNVTAYFFDEKMRLVDSVKAGMKGRQTIQESLYSNALPIPFSPKLKCLIKFKTAMGRGIHFTVLSYKEFADIKIKAHALNGIVDGIFLLAIIYSAIFAFMLRRRIYIYYMIYVGSFWIFMQPINQDATFFFSYFNLAFSEKYFIIPSYLLTISLILYTRELLQLKTQLPIFNKITMWVVGLLTIFLLIYIFNGWIWNEGNLNKIALLPSYIASIALLRKNYKAAWFVFAGITLIFLAHLSVNLNLNAYIPIFFTFSFYGILEIILFGVSITYWLKSLLIENVNVLKLALTAADEVALIKENQNIVLEKEVKKKTYELKAANEKLEASIEEVKNLNHYLEKDNFQLKVDVIGQLKARAEDKLMSYTEFKLYFPDEDACDKHIENIKWANGFVCVKCHGTEYVERKVTNKKPARRCENCNFVYTVSSYTLFHNLKFPIQKAFYLAYVICTKKSKTLEEFSLELDLRKGTIHAFIQKVKEAQTSLSNRKKHVDGWSHIISYFSKEIKEK